MNKTVKMMPIVCGSVSIASLIYFAFHETPNLGTIWEWLLLVATFLPSVAIAAAAIRNESEMLSKQVLIATLLITIPTIAIAVSADSSTWGDVSALLPLLGMTPVTLALSLWVLGAVLMERRSIHQKAKP